MDLPKAIHELEYGHGSAYGPDEEAALIDVLRANAPSCGPQVKKFEESFAAYCGAPYGLAVTSGTAGLQLAVIAARVEPGDEVITTPLSWISTANAAAAQGAKVVFADIDPRTLNLDPASVIRKITNRTKAIIVVHLYGQCCGINTDTCVLATTFAAGNRGYQPVVISDCVASMRGLDQHWMALEIMSRSIAWVLTIDEFKAKVQAAKAQDPAAAR